MIESVLGQTLVINCDRDVCVQCLPFQDICLVCVKLKDLIENIFLDELVTCFSVDGQGI